MNDYYSHHPLVRLDRHVVLAGFVAEETRGIGYRLAALTGLPVTDLDRSIEHVAGQSVWKLIWNEGEARYRELERVALRRALDGRPLGIITLGDGTLLDDTNRRAAAAEGHLISLDLDLAETFWRFSNGSSGASDVWHPLHAGRLERVEQVRPFYERRRPGLDAAPHHLDLRGLDKARAVAQLEAMLPTLVEA